MFKFLQNSPLFLCIFSCTTLALGCKEKPVNIDSSSYQATFVQGTESNIEVGFDFPDSLFFLDEWIYLKDWDIQERLDRELVINTHWHSNTIFYIKRAQRWFPMIIQVLRENNIPDDFFYLAVIESGLAQVTSPSGAKGFWQFLEGTAKEYKLIINDEIDERYHIAKSTQAACDYLNKAYEKFGSWSLAAAAYNRGMNGLQKAINHQKVASFYDLYLNQETSRYVFRMLAVKLIMENPNSFGFSIPVASRYQPYSLKQLEVTESIEDLVDWSKENGFNYKIVKLLNPWIIGSSLTITKQTPKFSVALPADQAQFNSFSSNTSE